MQFSLHTISKKYGSRVANMADSSSEAEMIAYGLEIFLGSLIKIVVLLTAANFLGIVREVLLLLFVTGSLRTLSGGAHCTAYYRCMLTSTIVMLVLGGAVKASYSFVTSLPTVLLAGLLLISFLLYWRFSPQAPLNKPLPNKAAERKFHYMTVATCALYSFVSLTIGTASLISWTIVTGMLWQAVTLTGIGHQLIHFFDELLTVKGGEAE